ncbi:MAG TPA: hypothetical protein DIV52_01585 [Ruminococcaceae bacterium]|jgi:uncharacterized phage protein (TIGR01671 family)|nr:hypothetical protein [Oscillospiraceae bacterium]
MVKKREIIFRGKRIDNGEWLFGDLRHIFHGEYRTHIVDNSNGLNNGVCGLEVDSSTIGQFTGLTDKNGRKIFEGDIIKWKYLCNDHLVYQVVYEKGTAGFVTRRNFNNRDGIDCYSDSVFDDDGDMSEVIGNIHDNPELLEVSKND